MATRDTLSYLTDQSTLLKSRLHQPYLTLSMRLTPYANAGRPESPALALGPELIST